LPGTEHVPPCDPRDCRFKCGSTCDASCADYIDYVLGKEEDVAAVVVETVRATDVQAPPLEYYRRLRQFCDHHGALLILDEIPSCLGRTGKMFAFEHYGIVPDMVVIGKGLGGGVFPMAAVIVREGLNVAADRALGHYTHEKSSLGCAAALATLDVIESEGLLARTTELGTYALRRMRTMQSRCPAIVDVRNVGLFLAIELDRAPMAEDVMYRCLSRGLSFKVGQGTVLVLAPPLIIDRADLDRALDLVEESIVEAASALS
jgi:4-aminobutyrate aminotransferase